MVKFDLLFKAELENVSQVYPSDDFDWIIKIKCSGCDTHSDKWHDVNEKNQITSDSKNKGTFHFSYKCKFCSRAGYLALLSNNSKKFTADDEDFVTLISLDCRGIEPIDFQPATGWIAISEGGTKFQDISLEDSEWYDYDESSGSPVGISSVQHKFVIK